MFFRPNTQCGSDGFGGVERRDYDIIKCGDKYNPSELQMKQMAKDRTYCWKSKEQMEEIYFWTSQ